VKTALAAGLGVCVCVGETEGERKAQQTFAVVEKQIKAILPSIDSGKWGKVCLAYEPLWAIGTGNTASAEQAQEVHKHIRGFVAKECSAEVAKNLRLAYGGSVKPKNAASLIAQADIDGFLVGGASLKADSFLEIVNHTQ
jgi:triosephosphate isomerase (TIM)